MALERQRRGERVPTILLKADAAHQERLLAFDLGAASAPSFGVIAKTLHDADVPDVQIASLLGLASRAEATHWVSIATHSPGLEEAIWRDGPVTFAHARVLLQRPPAEHAAWINAIERAGTNRGTRMSVQKLAQLVGAGVAASQATTDIAGRRPSYGVDTDAFVQQLGERLGCPVAIETARDGSTTAVRLTVFSVDEARGVMEKLASGDESVRGDNSPRQLRIELSGNDELQALVGHLLEEPY